jgi:hypothetical protein
MLKNSPKIAALLVAAGIAAIGIVQYLALSGLIAVPALGRIHWIFRPAYSIGGAFGVMFQWFLIAALIVHIMWFAKRKRPAAPADAEVAPQPAPTQTHSRMVRRDPPSFGRRGRA